MLIYWKSAAGLPACRQDAPLYRGEDHTDAILAVQESLIASGETYVGAVLALVGGTDAK